MRFLVLPMLLITLLAALIALATTVAAIRRRAAIHLSRPVIAFAIFPPLVMLGSFYSLAIHMHSSLGGWPSSIGMRGFPPLLVAHANIATGYFGGLLLSIFVLPVVILVCLLVPRWKRYVAYLALYGLLFVVCWVLMQLAPEPFLRWWRD